MCVGKKPYILQRKNSLDWFYFQALTKFLKSVNWSVNQEAKQALELLPKWSPMDVEDALELLSPAFSQPMLRKYAVARLEQADDEVIKDVSFIRICLL